MSRLLRGTGRSRSIDSIRREVRGTSDAPMPPFEETRVHDVTIEDSIE
jgi:hypothetical protein